MTSAALLRVVKAIKNKGSLRNSHSQRAPKEREDSVGPGVLGEGGAWNREGTFGEK